MLATSQGQIALRVLEIEETTKTKKVINKSLINPAIQDYK